MHAIKKQTKNSASDLIEAGSDQKTLALAYEVLEALNIASSCWLSEPALRIFFSTWKWLQNPFQPFKNSSSAFFMYLKAEHSLQVYTYPSNLHQIFQFLKHGLVWYPQKIGLYPTLNFVGLELEKQMSFISLSQKKNQAYTEKIGVYITLYFSMFQS